MAARSKIQQLPSEVRQQLEQALLRTNFSNYTQLADWCKTQGIDVSRAALHRFGSEFEQRVQAIQLATAQARAVVEASPDDDNAMNDALIRLAQEKVFAILVDSNAQNLDAVLLSKITKSIADVGRASVQQKKFLIEFRDRVLKQITDKADAAEKGGQKSKAELYREIREDIYGLT